MQDHGKSRSPRTINNFEILYSVVGSEEERKWFLWIDDISQHLGLAYCSFLTKKERLKKSCILYYKMRCITKKRTTGHLQHTSNPLDKFVRTMLKMVLQEINWAKTTGKTALILQFNLNCRKLSKEVRNHLPLLLHGSFRQATRRRISAGWTQPNH